MSNLSTPIAGSSAERGVEPAERDDRELAQEAWAAIVAQVIVPHTEPHTVASALSLSAGDQPQGDNADSPAEPGPGFESVDSDDATSPSTQSPRSPTNSGIPKLPAQLTTHINDCRLGRLELTVSRAPGGVSIVINVADSHVKALIEAEQAILLKSLTNTGIRVSSVRISGTNQGGTSLAHDREVSRDRARNTMNLRTSNPRLRAYRGSLDEDLDADSEGVNFKA
jgi:flagellar hook-length control protein FliK